MKQRREFLILMASGALVHPLMAVAADANPPVVGFMNPSSLKDFAPSVVAFVDGLRETGYSPGQNVVIEYRWGEDHQDRLTSLAADLMQRHVSVLVATGGPAAVLAAKAATSTIPIVFASGGDPVKLGILPQFSHPDGNVTGFHLMVDSLDQKRLSLLHEMVPGAKVVAVLVNPQSPTVKTVISNVQSAAVSLGLELVIGRASDISTINVAFDQFRQARAEGLLVTSDPFFSFGPNVPHLVELAASQRLPAIYTIPQNATDQGGLMSYGADPRDAYRQVGIYTGRILKGAKPGDLPVMQPTVFYLDINLKSAKAIGLAVPPSMLARADRVIE